MFLIERNHVIFVFIREQSAFWTHFLPDGNVVICITTTKKDATSTASAVGTVNAAFEDGKVTQKDLTSAVKGQLYYVESNLKAGIFGKEAVKLTSAEVS